MSKVRILLVAFALLNILVFVLGIYGFSYVSTKDSIFLGAISFIATVVPPFAFTGSFVMMVLSFFNIQTTADGRLIYNPKNSYWKLLEKMYSVNFSSGISLCKACWLTSLTTFLFFIGAIATFVVCFIIWATAKYGISWDLLEKIGKTLVFFVLLIFYFVFLCNSLKNMNEKMKMKETWKALSYAIPTFGSLFLVLVVLPIVLIMKKNEVALFPSMLFYLEYAGAMFGMIVGVLLVVFLTGTLFEFLANLSSDNLFKRFVSMIKMVKDNNCPIMTRSESSNQN